MVVPPFTIAVTMPVSEPTVATAVLLLLHVPPAVVSVNVVVDPAQTLVDPEIAAGDVLMVMVVVVMQPVLRV